MAGAKFVVSLNGDNLSPKYAPDNIAPAVIPKGMFKASAIPIKAIPTVADVVQLLPVANEIIEHIISVEAIKKEGFKISTPYYIIDGIMPLISQVPAKAPTMSKIIIGEVVDFILLATSLIILLYEVLLVYPTIPATVAPISKMN